MLGLGLIALGAATFPARAENKPERVNTALLHKNPIMKDMVWGKADAPVTIVEYASATCPHCADFHINEFPAIDKEYIATGKVRFIFREFPLDSVALATFMLIRCAAGDDAEKYKAVLNMVMKSQREWVKDPRGGLQKIMALAGLKDEAFEKCLQNQELAKKIANSARSASRDFQIESTPIFFVNGLRVEGRRPIAEFRKIIDAELQRASEGAK